MDVMLHQEVAEEVLSDLRARPGWDQFALVICTAMPNIHEIAGQLGCDAYLAKPFDLDDLLRLVARYGPSR
jgi:CheY-like chemotaxis protein